MNKKKLGFYLSLGLAGLLGIFSTFVLSVSSSAEQFSYPLSTFLFGAGMAVLTCSIIVQGLSAREAYNDFETVQNKVDTLSRAHAKEMAALQKELDDLKHRVDKLK